MENQVLHQQEIEVSLSSSFVAQNLIAILTKRTNLHNQLKEALTAGNNLLAQKIQHQLFSDPKRSKKRSVFDLPESSIQSPVTKRHHSKNNDTPFSKKVTLHPNKQVALDRQLNTPTVKDRKPKIQSSESFRRMKTVKMPDEVSLIRNADLTRNQSKFRSGSESANNLLKNSEEESHSLTSGVLSPMVPNIKATFLEVENTDNVDSQRKKRQLNIRVEQPSVQRNRILQIGDTGGIEESSDPSSEEKQDKFSEDQGDFLNIGQASKGPMKIKTFMSFNQKSSMSPVNFRKSVTMGKQLSVGGNRLSTRMQQILEEQQDQEQQIGRLADLLKTIPFFKQQLEENDKKEKHSQEAVASTSTSFEYSDLIEIAKSITLETLKPQDYAFQYQDVGDKFFIIIQGTVGVFVPDKQQVSEDALRERIERSEELFDEFIVIQDRIKTQQDRLHVLNGMMKQVTEILDKYTKPEGSRRSLYRPGEKRQCYFKSLSKKIRNVGLTPKQQIAQQNRPDPAEELLQAQKRAGISSTLTGQMIQGKERFALSGMDRQKSDSPDRRKTMVRISNVQKIKVDNVADPTNDPDLKVLTEKICSNQRNLTYNSKEEVSSLVQEIKDSLNVFVKRRLEIEFRLLLLRKKAKKCAEQRDSINLTEEETVFLRVNSLQAGTSFGELALISKKGTRTATIQADTLTHLAVISQEDYNKCFVKKEKQRREALIEFLRGIPSFSLLSRGALNKIVFCLIQHRFIKGQEVNQEIIANLKQKQSGLQLEIESAGGVEEFSAPEATYNFNDDEKKIKEQFENLTSVSLEQGEDLDLKADSVYLVMSGEFSAYQTMFVRNKGQDSSNQNDQRNKAFLNKSFESKFAGAIRHLKQRYGIDTSNESTFIKNHRGILNADKLESVTKKSALLYRPAQQKLQFEVLKFGKGQIFGEILSTLQHEATFPKSSQDRELMMKARTAALFCPNALSIRCTSGKGEVLRISTIEFQKKVMCYPRVASIIKKNIKAKLHNTLLRTIMRFRAVRDFNGNHQQISTLKLTQLVGINPFEEKEDEPIADHTDLNQSQVLSTQRSQFSSGSPLRKSDHQKDSPMQSSFDLRKASPKNLLQMRTFQGRCKGEGSPQSLMKDKADFPLRQINTHRGVVVENLRFSTNTVRHDITPRGSQGMRTHKPDSEERAPKSHMMSTTDENKGTRGKPSNTASQTGASNLHFPSQFTLGKQEESSLTKRGYHQSHKSKANLFRGVETTSEEPFRLTTYRNSNVMSAQGQTPRRIQEKPTADVSFRQHTSTDSDMDQIKNRPLTSKVVPKICLKESPAMAKERRINRNSQFGSGEQLMTGTMELKSRASVVKVQLPDTTSKFYIEGKLQQPHGASPEQQGIVQRVLGLKAARQLNQSRGFATARGTLYTGPRVLSETKVSASCPRHPLSGNLMTAREGSSNAMTALEKGRISQVISQGTTAYLSARMSACNSKTNTGSNWMTGCGTSPVPPTAIKQAMPVASTLRRRRYQY